MLISVLYSLSMASDSSIQAILVGPVSDYAYPLLPMLSVPCFERSGVKQSDFFPSDSLHKEVEVGAKAASGST